MWTWEEGEYVEVPADMIGPRDDLPYEVDCEACEGEGCDDCDGTGRDVI